MAAYGVVVPPSMPWHGVFCSSTWESCECGVREGWEISGEVFKNCIIEQEDKEL